MKSVQLANLLKNITLIFRNLIPLLIKCKLLGLIKLRSTLMLHMCACDQPTIVGHLCMLLHKGKKTKECYHTALLVVEGGVGVVIHAFHYKEPGFQHIE